MSPILLQINHTTVYPKSIYPNASVLIGGTSNATDSMTTTPIPPSTTDLSNKTAELAGYLVGHGKEITIAKNGEFATETNTSDTYGVLSENTKAQLNTLAGKLQTNDTEIGLHSKDLEVNQNKSKEAITFGKDLDWMKALDMNTQTTHKENSFIVTGQKFSSDNNGTQPSADQTTTATSNQTSPEPLDAPNHTLGQGPEQQVSGGPGQASNNDTSTSYIPTISASIAPQTDSNVVPHAKASHEDASQRNGNKTEFVGSENGSETYSESEAGGQVMNKINSSSTGIKDAYYNAQLDTVADAGSNGPKVMNSTSTMTSGGKISTDKIPAASEFIPKPQYTTVEKPAMTQPTNDVINPLQVSDKSFDSSQAAGAGAGAGAGSESETVVGNLAETLAGLNQSHTEASTKTLDNDSETLQPKGNQTASMYPQTMGPVQPSFPNRTKDDPKIFITDDMRSGTGTSTDAGSESYSQVGSFGGSGSNVANNQTTSNRNHTLPSNTTSTMKGETSNVGGSKPSGHITLVSPATTNQRIFQSVSDVISDSSLPQLCPDGRDCINKPLTNEKVITGVNTTATEATSNQTLDASKEDNKFNLTLWFHHKKIAIVGTANEIDEIGAPQKKEETSVKNDHIPEQPSKALLLPSPVSMKKQNIGFNVMLPSNFIKQLANIPKFKEVESSVQSTINKNTPEQLSFIRRPRPKAAIKKVLDMITDPARTRKANVPVPHVSDILSSAIHEPDTVEMMAMDAKEGDMGDMGAVKPVSRDTVLEVPFHKSDEHNQTSDGAVTTNANAASNIQHSSTASETSGDLGSIVTLVGKSNSKRTKQNDTANTIDENNAQKKTMESSEQLALKHTQHNASSSGETNAANINQVTGPSNSIIVSSVIVVLIAAFVVVGMAVVAVVAVVARHCNLGKHLQTAS